MQYLELECWPYEGEAQGNLRVPFCGRELKEIQGGGGRVYGFVQQESPEGTLHRRTG
jgi:hypothetical protein